MFELKARASSFFGGNTLELEWNICCGFKCFVYLDNEYRVQPFAPSREFSKVLVDKGDMFEMRIWPTERNKLLREMTTKYNAYPISCSWVFRSNGVVFGHNAICGFKATGKPKRPLVPGFPVTLISRCISQ